MVRPHGELLYNAGFGTIGLGISHVRFPNGDISSTQAAVTCQFPLTAVMAQGWKQEAPPSLAPGTPATAGGRRYLLNYRHLYPGNDVKAIDGTRNTESLGLLGAELQQRVTDNLHVGISVAGAVAGNADGYAQLLMGAGVEFPVRERTALTAGVAIGAGGGGKIDTGGGLLAQGEVGLRYHLDDGWAMGLSAGYLVAPDGSFRATQVGAALSYGPSANKGSAAPLFAGRWRIRGGVQSYVPSGTIRYADAGEDDAIDLVAVKIDRFLDNGFYATGQALAACDGGAGGYAVGLVGLGWSTPLAERSPFFAMGELLMGAGGGGNVDSGSGLLLQPMAGIGWQINSRTDLILSGGFVTAPNGRLAVPVADAAIAWRFSTLESR